MEHSYDEWIASANDALEISLVRPSPTGLHTIDSFHPTFTYPIFGNEESIIGYKNLKMQLRYNAADMRPNFHTLYSKKLKAVGEQEPTDVEAILKDFLPAVAFQKPSEFEAAIQQTAAAGAFVPPGQRLRTFQSSAGGRYEVWMGSLADAAVKQLINRIQIFVPLFIEGGTFISTDGSDPADRWSIFFLYRTRQAVGSAQGQEYEFAGYSTVYRFLLPAGPGGVLTPPSSSGGSVELELPAAEDGCGNSSVEKKPVFSLSLLPCRSRLSQFIILPPFQGKGNAGRLYRAVFDQYLNEPQTTEITVEDPNEAFDDVRDLADLAYLTTALPAFSAAVRINTAVTIPKTGPSPRNIVDPATLETLRRQTKIAPRQFHRLVEMYLMHQLPASVRPSLDEAEEEEAEQEGQANGKGKGKGKGKAAASEAPATKATATKEEQHQYKLWRLFVKQRLYRHNREILGQLERHQRIDKLEETLRSVELEYARILSMFESNRAKLEADRRLSSPPPPPPPSSLAIKRSAADDASSEANKKPRVEEA